MTNNGVRENDTLPCIVIPAEAGIHYHCNGMRGGLSSRTTMRDPEFSAVAVPCAKDSGSRVGARDDNAGGDGLEMRDEGGGEMGGGKKSHPELDPRRC
ncbi:hypothetical protein A2372_04220 [Candidatus Wolfebacteria bacterium RIFOXYB1_FULL_54_12]|uniref:Uncharacterized protein n=1 Tax=Candidatus Wolfebacteria bacterium RIFOXYB1_FULL_54_12 TaxID=1802559 RepID=A0A1F8DX36_9BACT|nr:MAG: hypothetical protein A2372_04220 [Candidatus Wolfebacteria bacterium RIFOXYB1_FULL_54_12]